jgi:hypothetical protein
LRKNLQSDRPEPILIANDIGKSTFSGMQV